MRVEALVTAKNTKSGNRRLDQAMWKKGTYMFARQLEPIQDEKCQHQLPIAGQYPDVNEYDKGLSTFLEFLWATLTKVTDRLIVHTPTMVNQPFIHDESKRRGGDVSRKHQ